MVLAEPIAETSVSFERHPDTYRHWRLGTTPPIAILSLAVDVDGGVMGHCPLELDSDDIGVDIELPDANRRLRFEHPDVGCVVITSAVGGTFCAGANIRVLAEASHAHKVNFCMTRLTDTRRMQRDRADAATETEGMQGADALAWGLVDELASPRQYRRP